MSKLLNEIYENPELYWSLSPEDKVTVDSEMKETLEKLLLNIEHVVEAIKPISEALAGYAKMVDDVLSKY
jgi:hypothetical protein